MSNTFDTMGYAKHLHKAGVPAKQATAHAEAARDYMMNNLATQKDLKVLELSLTIKLGAIAMVASGVIIAAMRVMLAG